MPRELNNIYGRDCEIQTIEKKIYQNAGTMIITSLDGMPAVGKTTLAVKLAYKLKYNYPYAQLYIDCYGYTADQSPLNPEKILDILLFSLQISPQSISNSYIGKLNLWRNLISTSKLRMIIIFDNVKDHKQIESLLPSSSNCLVIITSRNRLLGLSDVYRHEVRTLDEASALSLIKNISNINSNDYDDIIKKIAQKYGFLPLPLQIVSSRIRNRSYEYIKRVAEEDLDITANDNYVMKALYYSFNISYSCLNIVEKKIFCFLGVMPTVDFTPESCSSMADINIQKMISILDNMFENHLIEETGDERYRYHDTIRLYAKEKFNECYSYETQLTAVKKIINYYVETLKQYSNGLRPVIDIRTNKLEYMSYDNSKIIDWFYKELENIFSCLEFAYKNKLMYEYWCLSYSIIPLAYGRISGWSINDMLGISYNYISKSRNKDKIAITLADMALAKHQIGNFNVSYDLYKKAIVAMSDIKDDLGLAYTLSNYGFTLERLGEYSEALRALESAYNIYNEKGNKFGISTSMNSIGAVYWRKHEYDIAASIFKRVCVIRKEIGDYQGLSSTINNLAYTYLKLKNETKARNLFYKSLEISKKYSLLSGQAVTLNNLGYTEIYAKNFTFAIKYATESHDIAIRINDEYQRARSCDVMGKAYLGLNQKERANEFLLIAEELFKNLNVPEKDDVLDYLN